MSMDPSSHKDPQITAFADDLTKLVDRYRYEYDLTYASVIGALMMKCWQLSAEVEDSQEGGEAGGAH